MDNYDTKELFLAALKKELADMDHGDQAGTDGYAGVSVSLLNDSLRDSSFGAEEKRRTVAAALGFEDYEAFLDIGRTMTVLVMHQAALEDELIELLRENRKLRREIDDLKAELEKVQGLMLPMGGTTIVGMMPM